MECYIANTVTVSAALLFHADFWFITFLHLAWWVAYGWLLRLFPRAWVCQCHIRRPSFLMVYWRLGDVKLLQGRCYSYTLLLNFIDLVRPKWIETITKERCCLVFSIIQNFLAQAIRPVGFLKKIHWECSHQIFQEDESVRRFTTAWHHFKVYLSMANHFLFWLVVVSRMRNYVCRAASWKFCTTEGVTVYLPSDAGYCNSTRFELWKQAH